LGEVESAGAGLTEEGAGAAEDEREEVPEQWWNLRD